MPKYIYKFNGAPLAAEVWEDASFEELRVLVYLMTVESATEDAVAEACGATKARTKSALALWREANVVTRESMNGAEDTQKPITPTVTLEFEERHTAVGVDEISSEDAAQGIRDGALAELMSDIASLLSKPALNTYEAKHIAAAYEQYAVSAEYIITLASYMAEAAASKGRSFTTKMLTDKVSTLVGRGIDNLEALEAYIDDQAKDGGKYYELRRVFSIWKRNPSKTEIKYFDKWTDELGYGTEIIDEARDIAVANTNAQPFPYIDKLLVAWHAAGLKTLGEIADYTEKQRLERAASTAPKKNSAGKQQSDSKTPKYSSFDYDEAMRRALERSYADDND